MAITLDHTIIPARDKIASAKFFAKLFGLKCDDPLGTFAPVRINDALTFDFDDRRQGFEVHHYAFHVSDEEFDAIFGRVKDAHLPYGSQPWSREDMQVRHVGSGRVVFFCDLNGHLLEIRTIASRDEMERSALET
jgi:catechol 2,3-dioxygenase-like lactoylglutathione lyase family enzyme